MKINLHGVIADSESKKWDLLWTGDSDLVTFKDVNEALASKADDDKLVEIDINCPGGNVMEGFAIYDSLRSMEGCLVKSMVRGECSSMATIVLLAASERISQPNAYFCVHKPRFSDYYTPTMTEDDAKRLYDDLHAETERLKKIYLERTKMDEATLDALMNDDKYITAEQALEYGLITEIAQPMTAVKHKSNTLKAMKKHTLKAWQKKAMTAIGLAELVAEIEQQEAVAMTLNKEDGSTIEVEREEGDPQVGDAASPDGEHLMSDGTTIVIADGVITEIRPAEEEEETEEEAMTSEEMQATIASMTETINELTAENEELKQQLSASKANEKTAEDCKVLQLVANAGGLKWLEGLKTTHKPKAREITNTQLSAEAERQRMLEEARHKYKNK